MPRMRSYPKPDNDLFGLAGKVTAMDIDGKVAVSFDPLTLNIPALVSFDTHDTGFE